MRCAVQTDQAPPFDRIAPQSRERPPQLASPRPANRPTGAYDCGIYGRTTYGCGIKTGNSGSFGVPMRSDTSTSHGSQPWLTSTSLCTDMYM